MDQSSGGNGARKKRRFSTEFKEEALHLLRQRRARGVSLSQVARELELRPGLLWRWAQAAAHTPDAGDVPNGPPGETLEEEVKRLRRENATLRQERDFVKKAAAFFMKESL